MPTWSGTRKKLETDYLCPALQGRVRYFAATYRKSHDREGRAAILVDGGEVLKSDYFTYARILWQRARDYRDEQGLNWREAYLKADKTVLDRKSTRLNSSHRG